MTFFPKIITTELVVVPKLVFFVEEFFTDAILLLLIFFDLLKEFHWKDCFRSILTTVPIIVKTLSGAHFRRWHIL